MPSLQEAFAARPELSFAFLSSRWRVEFAVSGDFDSPIVDQFFNGYDAAFILPSEKEQLAGFRQCLEVNSGPSQAELARRFGPFRELVFVARDPDNPNSVIGGGNLIVCPLYAHGHADSAYNLCTNLNYIYVAPAARRRGYLRRLVGGVDEIARRTYATLRRSQSNSWGEPVEPTPETIPHIIFLEHNDPVRMSAEDYVRDTAHGGMDQFDRLRVWARLGARILDFPYVQPPLAVDQVPNDNLLYAVLGIGGSHVAPSLLREHLERFFSISVLKGAEARLQPCAARQLSALDSLDIAGLDVPLLDPRPWLAAHGHFDQTNQPKFGHASSFRDLIRH